MDVNTAEDYLVDAGVGQREVILRRLQPATTALMHTIQMIERFDYGAKDPQIIKDVLDIKIAIDKTTERLRNE